MVPALILMIMVLDFLISRTSRKLTLNRSTDSCVLSISLFLSFFLQCMVFNFFHTIKRFVDNLLNLIV